MPLFMDVHLEIEDMDVETIRKGHLMDLAIQHKYGVKHVHYYVNEKESMGFCLISGPDKESCARVHKESHGNVANNLIEVEKQTYEALMGIVQIDDTDLVLSTDGLPDLGYRFILFAEIIGFNMDAAQLLSQLKTTVNSNIGRIAQSTETSVTAFFTDSNNAIICSARLFQLMESQGRNVSDLKIGLATGIPVTKTGVELFEDAIKFSKRLAKIAKPGRIFSSSATGRFYQGKVEDLLSKFSTSILTQPQEDFINHFFNSLEELGESGWSIGLLCKKMGISRAQLYRKIRELSGLSPRAFIREFRLINACGLIRSNNASIAEIAYALGYNKPAIFSAQFKTRFGLTPSQVLKHLH